MSAVDRKKVESSESPTLDSIYAAHAATVAEANALAAAHGCAKLTAADVYEKFAPAKEDATPEAILDRIYARAGGNR
jgi:succinylarginine dihydrolase